MDFFFFDRRIQECETKLAAASEAGDFKAFEFLEREIANWKFAKEQYANIEKANGQTAG